MVTLVMIQQKKKNNDIENDDKDDIISTAGALRIASPGDFCAHFPDDESDS